MSGWERPGLELFSLSEMGVLVKVGGLGAGILRSSLGDRWSLIARLRLQHFKVWDARLSAQ